MLSNASKNMLPEPGGLYYWPAMFSKAEADGYFEFLKNAVPWQQEPIRIFGREVMQPRLTAWFGDKAYSYSGISMSPLAFPEQLLEMKTKVEKLSGSNYNSALLNFYRNGADSMGWHRDNEKMLGPAPVIASLSLELNGVFY